MYNILQIKQVHHCCSETIESHQGTFVDGTHHAVGGKSCTQYRGKFIVLSNMSLVHFVQLTRYYVPAHLG